MGGTPRYPVVIFWSDADGGFIADIPDIRYCSAFGRSPEEALAELAIAKDLWLTAVARDQERIPPATSGADIIACVREHIKAS